MRYLIKTLEGIEPACAKELENMGASNIEILTRAVSCEGDMGLLYKANIMLRTALKVLVPMATFEAKNEDQLYNEVYAMPWEKIFEVSQTFAIDATVQSNIFTHSHYVALKVKDAIADRFRDKLDERPFVNPLTPNISINVHIRERQVTLSLDSSGESLHMRGYRINSVEAPINEVLAAGMILLSEWDGKTDFWDPMCGSGTIAIEAARIACGIPPQKKSRTFLFQNWANYDENLFNKIKQESHQASRPTCTIYASDKSIQAIKATQINAEEAGVAMWIKVDHQNFFKNPKIQNRFIITNPPYDERLELEDVKDYYKSIGDHLKQNCLNCTAWIISGNIDGIKAVGLKPNKKYTLNNGAIEAKYYKYDIYDSNAIYDEEE